MKTSSLPGDMMNDTACNWSEIGRIVGPCIRPGGPVLTERALEICSLPPGSLVADVGCGAGGTLEYLERTGLYHLVGIDPSETLLREASSRLETARLFRGEAETIPFENDTFDLLFCECVLSIVDDKPAALDEFARVVKEGGLVAISDVFSKDGHGIKGEAGGLHTLEEILDLVTRSGFTLVQWEAHDRLLKEFAVRMILAGECVPDSWGCGRKRQDEKSGRAGISYFLLVARKSGGTSQ